MNNKFLKRDDKIMEITIKNYQITTEEILDLNIKTDLCCVDFEPEFIKLHKQGFDLIECFSDNGIKHHKYRRIKNSKSRIKNINKII